MQPTSGQREDQLRQEPEVLTPALAVLGVNCDKCGQPICTHKNGRLVDYLKGRGVNLKRRVASVEQGDVG